MLHFLGNIEVKIDAKGRFFIPVQFRKQLQAGGEENLVLKKDVFRDCLILYPESVWNKDLNELVERVNKWTMKGQDIIRNFMWNVDPLTPDTNGRILIPKRYLQLVGIQTDIRLVGIHDKIEIWAKEKSEESLMDPDDLASALEEMMGGNTNNTQG